jgi:hypothetical protein
MGLSPLVEKQGEIMKEDELYKLVENAKDDFLRECPGEDIKKYSGALTIEVIKRELENQGIRTSPRDVFINGLNQEIDLIIPREEVKPEHGLLYQPQDVLVVFEIKKRGTVGNAIETIRNTFNKVRALSPKIYCAYVTLSERKSFQQKVTTADLGPHASAFTLTWYSGSGKNSTPTSTCDWDKLIEKLREIVQTA